MKKVLAFVDDSPSARSVLRTAEALASTLDAEVVPVTVTNTDGSLSTEPEQTLLESLRSGDVVLGVLGSRAVASKPQPVGHVAAALLVGSPIPLAVVPPGDGALSSAPTRLLLPLDGTPETAAALVPVARRLHDAGTRIVVMHVYTDQTVPRFISSSDDIETLADEFLIQHLPEFGDDCELRIGQPDEEILDRASAGDIDGVILAWRQDLSPGRANVIHRLLQEVRVPLLMVPMASRRSDDPSVDDVWPWRGPQLPV